MVNDSITQLLFNALAQHRTTVLPGIGSLRFRRIAAKLEGSTLTPPRNMFRFSSREEGCSLLDMVIAKAGCTREEGEEAYRRWLRRVKQGHSVVIEGVGRIEEDFFKPSEELERLLNPAATAPITLRRRRSLRGVWIGLAAAALVAIAGAAWWFMQSEPKVAPAPEVVAQKVEPAESKEVDSAVVEEGTAPIEEVAAAVDATPAPATTPTEIGVMTSGVSYVVLGVFSTEENARKYVKQMSTRVPEIECRIYHFQGTKFMVSGFESTDGTTVSAFIREHRSALPDLWIYKRK